MPTLKKQYTFRTILTTFLVALFVATAILPVEAQRKDAPKNDDKRREWMKEMREYKHKFLKQELKLTRDQEAPFFKAYDQMDDELIRIGEETRALERKALKNSDASDTELESAARTIYEQKKKEGEVELRYFEEFGKILTKKQLVRIKEVERRMNRALLKNSKSAEKKKDKK